MVVQRKILLVLTRFSRDVPSTSWTLYFGFLLHSLCLSVALHRTAVLLHDQDQYVYKLLVIRETQISGVQIQRKVLQPCIPFVGFNLSRIYKVVVCGDGATGMH